MLQTIKEAWTHIIGTICVILQLYIEWSIGVSARIYAVLISHGDYWYDRFMFHEKNDIVPHNGTINDALWLATHFPLIILWLFNILLITPLQSSVNGQVLSELYLFTTSLALVPRCIRNIFSLSYIIGISLAMISFVIILGWTGLAITIILVAYVIRQWLDSHEDIFAVYPGNPTLPIRILPDHEEYHQTNTSNHQHHSAQNGDEQQNNNSNKYPLIYFINGVCTTPHWHRSNCQYLEEHYKCQVRGIYNSSYGILSDLVECLLERNFNIDDIIVFRASELIKEKLIQRQHVLLIAHSQGGILASLIIQRIWLQLSSAHTNYNDNHNNNNNNTQQQHPAHSNFADRMSYLSLLTFGSAAKEIINPEMSALGHMNYIEHYINSHDLVGLSTKHYFTQQRNNDQSNNNQNNIIINENNKNNNNKDLNQNNNNNNNNTSSTDNTWCITGRLFQSNLPKFGHLLCSSYSLNDTDYYELSHLPNKKLKILPNNQPRLLSLKKNFLLPKININHNNNNNLIEKMK